MPAELDEYFRCVKTEQGWEFQVGVVTWPEAHMPTLAWKTFRLWKTQPDASRTCRAQAAVLRQPRFFRTCSSCHEITNAGQMDDAVTCQSCASREFGVLY